MGDKGPPAGNNYYIRFISSNLRKLTYNNSNTNFKSATRPTKSRNLNTGVKYFGVEKIKRDGAQDSNAFLSLHNPNFVFDISNVFNKKQKFLTNHTQSMSYNF